MTTQTLSRVTLQTLENYRTAATQAVVAYRLGSHRLVGVVNGALENNLYPRTAKLAPGATERMNEVRGNVSDIVIKGIDQMAERTEKAIDLGADTAAAQVAKVADFAAGIDNEMVVNGLQTAVRLSMPGAKLALVVSGKVAERAEALVEAAGGKPVKKAMRRAGAVAKRKTAPVARKAKVAVKTVAKRTRKAVAEVVEAPKVQRVRRAAKKVVAEVAAA
jgi:hypothetical protein